MYGEERIHVLRGVDLKVGRGEMVGVFGPSGSGKSTLLHIISTLDFADEGYVEVMDTVIDPRRMGEDDLAIFRRKYIGIIFQSHNLFPEMTALENVYFPLLMKGYSPLRARRRAEEVLESLGLRDEIKKNVQYLSGGERQRVAVARAIAMGAEVYVCDEPTAELDKENALNLMEVLRALCEEGRTFIIATHDERLLPYFHTVYTLDSGVLKRKKKEVEHGENAGSSE